MAKSPRNGSLGKVLMKGPAPSMSPDDMKNYSNISGAMLNALTRSQQGTGQRAVMPRQKRKMFVQNYWAKGPQHQDSLHGDPYGVTSQREGSSGGRVR